MQQIAPLAHTLQVNQVTAKNSRTNIYLFYLLTTNSQNSQEIILKEAN